MAEAQTILKMIEEAAPDDTDTLDEIDARVWCFLNNIPWSRIGRSYDDAPYAEEWFYFDKLKSPFNRTKGLSTKYTRSRDALKSIRPEGWVFNSRSVRGFDPYSYKFTTSGFKPVWDREKQIREDIHHIYKPGLSLPTEELAELHAIIQAIDYERQNDDR